MRESAWIEDLSISFDPVGSWGLVALVTALLAAVLVAVPPDRTRAGGRRLAALVGLRLLAFLALVFCLLRPTIVAARKSQQQGTVLVLGEGDRLEAMPEGCTESPATTPQAVADAFLDAFERHYAFFDRRPPGHAGRAARVRAAIRPDMSEAELWDALAGYMQGLSDSHTKLIGNVGGERRRVQDGQGETLPRMRAAEGGESAWLIGLIGTTMQKLGDTGHHTGNDRIVWGVIDGRVGYLQVFQMGGFTDREDFGSEAWAAAEMAEFDRIMDEAFAAFADAGVKGVILDLSNNRGGWDKIAKAIPARFTDEAYVGFTTVTRGSGLAPFPHMIAPASGPRFAGPVYLLTSDVTVSGGELATLALRQNPRVIHAGATTRGAFSTPLAKRLPNGWLLELSNEVFAAPDGSVYEESGIAPQVPLAVYPAASPVEGHWRAVESLAAMIGGD